MWVVLRMGYLKVYSLIFKCPDIWRFSQISLLLIYNFILWLGSIWLCYFGSLKLTETSFVTQLLVIWVSIPWALETLSVSYSSQKKKDKLDWGQNGPSLQAEMWEWCRLMCSQWLWWCILYGRGSEGPFYVWVTTKL